MRWVLRTLGALACLGILIVALLPPRVEADFDGRAVVAADFDGDVFRAVPDQGQRTRIEVAGEQYLLSRPDAAWSLQGEKGGGNLLRFEIREGFRAPFDQDRDRPYIRSEINGVTDYPGGVWLAFDVYFPDIETLLPTGTTMIAQVKARATRDHPDPGPPVLRIDALSTGIYVRIGQMNDKKASTVTIGQLESLRERTWDRFIANVVPGAHGSVRVWRNGEMVLDRSGISVGFDGFDSYVKFGVYANDTIGSQVVIHANLRQGKDLSPLINHPLPLPDVAERSLL